MTLPTPIVQFPPPHGMAAVREVYGSFAFTELSGGNIHVLSSFERDNIVTLHEVAGTHLSVQMHRKVADSFIWCLTEAQKTAPDYKVRMLGGYCPRHQMHLATNPLSIHSWGAAVDINWDTNTLGVGGKRDLPEAFVMIFESQGWEWGGRWKNPDWMHFQFATGV